MHHKRRFTACVVIFSLLFSSLAHPEAVDDTFTQMSPTESLGIGEFIHGAGYRRLLVRVLMFGAVTNQGIHYVPEGTDLLFALLYSGGVADTTKLDGITIRRKSQAELIYVDLEEMLEEGHKIPRLQDGDIVNVPFNWRRDINTVGLVTNFITSMTALTVGVLALTKR